MTRFLIPEADLQQQREKEIEAKVRHKIALGKKLFYACANGNSDLVAELLTQDPDFIYTNGGENNCIHVASENEDEDILVMLFNAIKEKAPDKFLALLNAKNLSGATPLHYAVLNEDRNWATTMFVGVKCGYKDTAELLITNGADPHAKDNKGETPLDWCKYNKSTREYLKKCMGKEDDEEESDG